MSGETELPSLLFRSTREICLDLYPQTILSHRKLRTYPKLFCVWFVRGVAAHKPHTNSILQ